MFPKNRPHLFEKICLSVDYELFKKCLDVHNTLRCTLTSKIYQQKAKSGFQEEILGDEKKLWMTSKGMTEKERKLKHPDLSLHLHSFSISWESPLPLIFPHLVSYAN